MSNIKKGNTYLKDKDNIGDLTDYEVGDLIEQYDENGIPESDLYPEVQKKLNYVLQGTTAPTTSTVGYVGQLYVDTSSNAKLYKCTAVSGTTYTWEEVGGGKLHKHHITLQGVGVSSIEFSAGFDIYSTTFTSMNFNDVVAYVIQSNYVGYANTAEGKGPVSISNATLGVGFEILGMVIMQTGPTDFTNRVFRAWCESDTFVSDTVTEL